MTVCKCSEANSNCTGTEKEWPDLPHSPFLRHLVQYQPQRKLQNLSEISRFAVCGLRLVTVEKVPQLQWSVCARIDQAALPHELFKDWSLIWSIYTLVWSYIFIRLLTANKNSPVDLVKFAITENFKLIRDSTNKFLRSFGKRWIVSVPESWITSAPSGFLLLEAMWFVEW